ncbi:membrane anchor subunit of succinate dehydrogenase, Sdh4 [Thoreauomyces humboldtii]|nr:membrane anchor subunit of succinate dehydrogenase, Sdh4 [Thoreauomyces humboldtii]
MSVTTTLGSRSHRFTMRAASAAARTTTFARPAALGARCMASQASPEIKSRMHGSYHWDLERALSVLTIPLLAAPFFIGAHPLVDLGLGVVIPLHSHIGLDAVIQDYLPVRRNPVAYRVSTGLLYTATGLCLYGCYQFNTNDIGITEFVKRLWVGKA